ncbi:MAG: putative Ig domain-containing protein, partial [Candidatus Yanofskybacteria bacterium]|nr:putative Ig domain-containing protein [Candidatus Yanofskybacteria bacterium]
LPAGLTLSAGGVISGKPTTAGTATFTVRVEDSSSPKLSATKSLSIVTTATSATLACMFHGVNYSTFNLCSEQRRPGGCGNSTCAQYLSSINKYAGGAATVDVLKTFLVIESDCNIKASTTSSYGLMQLRPETAGDFTRNCGMGAQASCTAAGGTWSGSSSAVGRCNVTGSWLTNPANADKSICLGAAYIRSLAAGTCGPEPRNLYAGYNAGAGNCAPSRDCGNEQSCGGGVKKKWECPYDNPEHTVCNVGLPLGELGLWQTKQGATYVNYCINNLGF